MGFDVRLASLDAYDSAREHCCSVSHFCGGMRGNSALCVNWPLSSDLLLQRSDLFWLFFLLRRQYLAAPQFIEFYFLFLLSLSVYMRRW